MTKRSQPSSICILRLSAIGDVCHAVASVQAIQRQWPSTKITWIIGKIEAQLLSDLPHVKFVVFDKKAGFKAYQTLWRSLKNQDFDILLHMQVAIRASLITLGIKAKEKWGFDRSRAKEGQWLFTNRKIAAQTHAHVAEGFWSFAQAIGVSQGEKPSWDMPVRDVDKAWCRQQLSSSTTNNNTNGYIVISPAASKIQRNWLSERYAALADYAKEKGYQVVISGGPSDLEKQVVTEIMQAAQYPVINLVGKSSLKQLLALLSEAKLVIAPDSGPAHMATTVGTPVIGLYAHSNPQRTGPYHSLNTTISVYEELLVKQTVKSIEHNPWGKRVKGDDLMKLISVESVIAAFDRLI